MGDPLTVIRSGIKGAARLICSARNPSRSLFHENLSGSFDEDRRKSPCNSDADVFIRFLLTLFPIQRPEFLVVKWHSYLVIGLLVIAVLTAGCMDEEPALPELPPSDVVQPGQVLVTTGAVTGDGIAGGTLDTITFTVKLAPGEKPVDMEKISIIYADTIRTETLIPVEGYVGDPPTGTWGIIRVTNQVGAPNNRLEDQEEFTIRINPKAYLPANRMITLVVRTPIGAPLTFRRVAPPTIVAENNQLIAL